MASPNVPLRFQEASMCRSFGGGRAFFLLRPVVAIGIVLILGALGCAKHRRGGGIAPVVESCAERVDAGKLAPVRLREGVEQDGAAFLVLAEETLARRAQTLALSRRISADEGGPLSSADQDDLKRHARAGLDASRRMSELAVANDCWTRIDPGDPAIRRDGNRVALAAALLFFDTYAVTLAVLNEDARIRRFLNQSDIGYGIREDQLEALRDAHLSVVNRFRINEQIQFHEAHPGPPSSPELEYADLFIRQSPSYDVLREITPADSAGQRAERIVQRSEDQLAAVGRLGVGGVSRAFGNAVGLVQFRDGILYGDDDAASALREQLEPGDILIEKTPFRLTDKLIPGYWGHAALWVGTESELRSLGIWEHPVVRRHHDEIRAGNLVVEALRDGVQMNPLEHFLNVDDVAVLRRRSMDDAQRAERVILTLRQVGKEYDFNFDVDTTDRIVCSQLVYLVYTDVDWQTDRALGRYTVSPDQVAARAVDGSALDVVALVHEGKPVPATSAELARLMRDA